MWCNYIKERLGHESVYNESGFLTYTSSPNSVLILDAYVVPEKRNSGVMQELFNDVFLKAVESNKDNLYASVAPNEQLKNTNTAALKFLLKNGFQLLKADNKNVFFVKNLKDK
jgi:predicted GNAT superfamily acetyltransferase